MAAPNISGFAALLMEYFPEYNTGLISDILVSSSKDLDTPGVDLRSGWGAPQMAVALRGPTALRDTREVTVASGTIDIWSNSITDARDRYSAEVLAGFPNDIGGLVKRGGGELILTAANSYSGPTRVEQGQLTVDGSLTRSAVTAVAGGIVAVVSLLREGDAAGLAGGVGRVEEAEFDTCGVLGEEGEIHAVAIPGGAERRGFSWPYGVVVDHGTADSVVIGGVWMGARGQGNGGNTRSKIAQRDAACQ
jgi:autotransporter-associated beta strand protein